MQNHYKEHKLLPIPQDHHIDDISLVCRLYAYQKKTLLEHSVVISIDFYLIIQYNFVDKVWQVFKRI